MDKLSYALGLSFGQSLRQNDIKGIDYNSFAKGIEAMCEGTRPELSVQEAQELLNEYFTKKETEKEQSTAGLRQEGEAFLAENAKRAEVKVTESGLQYEIITDGKGAKPTASDRVNVHYHGTLINGTVFDSSVIRNEPATFGVTQVIAGWDKERIINTMNGYKNGTYGGIMKNIMKPQVETKTDEEIEILATYISNIK